MEIRPLTLSEQKYTYAQSMQISGQTGNIGHLRGDFAYTGYGFYTTWFDNRTQWKTAEFKSARHHLRRVLSSHAFKTQLVVFRRVREQSRIRGRAGL